MTKNLFNVLNGTPVPGGTWVQLTGPSTISPLGDGTAVCFNCVPEGVYTFEYTAAGNCASDPAVATVNVVRDWDYTAPSGSTILVCRINGVNTYFLDGNIITFPIDVSSEFSNISHICDANTNANFSGDAVSLSLSEFNSNITNPTGNAPLCDSLRIFHCIEYDSSIVISLMPNPPGNCAPCAGGLGFVDWNVGFITNIASPNIPDLVICLPNDSNSGTINSINGTDGYLDGSSFYNYYNNALPGVLNNGLDFNTPCGDLGVDFNYAQDGDATNGISFGSPGYENMNSDISVDSVNVGAGNITYDNIIDSNNDPTGVIVVPIVIDVESAEESIDQDCHQLTNTFDVTLISVPDIEADIPIEICSESNEILISLDTIYGVDFNDIFFDIDLDSSLQGSWNIGWNTGSNTLVINDQNNPTPPGTYTLTFTPSINYNGAICEGNPLTITFEVVVCALPCSELESQFNSAQGMDLPIIGPFEVNGDIDWEFDVQTVSDRLIIYDGGTSSSNIILDTGCVSEQSTVGCGSNSSCGCSDIFLGDFTSNTTISLIVGSGLYQNSLGQPSLSGTLTGLGDEVYVEVIGNCCNDNSNTIWTGSITCN